MSVTQFHLLIFSAKLYNLTFGKSMLLSLRLTKKTLKYDQKHIDKILIKTHIS